MRAGQETAGYVVMPLLSLRAIDLDLACPGWGWSGQGPAIARGAPSLANPRAWAAITGNTSMEALSRATMMHDSQLEA